MDLEKKVAVSLPGSLPNGGSVKSTPLWSVKTPTSLRLYDTANANIPIKNVVNIPGDNRFRSADNPGPFTITSILSKEICNSLIQMSEDLGFRDEAPGIRTPPGMRMNKTVHWISDNVLMEYIFERIKSNLPQEIDGHKLHPRLSHRINVYKYNKGDVFNKHIDGDYVGYEMNEENGELEMWDDSVCSKLTMLLYLNDGMSGGSTRLFSDDEISCIDVEPEVGSALFFRHGFGPNSVQHQGNVILGDNLKYVARLNIMYSVL